MKDTSVSILIPCYNYGRFLGEAIESALAQTHPALEVIVMDDGSSDNTQSVAAGYSGRVRYHHTPNQGLSATLNTALQLATGAYYVWLDADNRLSPGFVSKTVAAMQSVNDPLLAFVYTQQRYFEDREGLTARPPFDPNLLKERNYIDACSLVRTDVGRRFLYDPTPVVSRVPDYDFYLTLAENGFYGLLLDQPLVDYRVHSSSMGRNIGNRYEQVSIMKAILRKHATFYTAAERQSAVRAAQNRLLISVIHNRLPGRPFLARLRDMAALITANPGLEQWWNQFRYLVTPGIFPQHYE